MSQNNLNTMYGGGFARILDSENRVYRLVNVINAKAMFETQTDTLRAVFPNAPSQVIATATTQMNCNLVATLAEFNKEQLSLASNLIADQPGDDATMPVINERHVCLSNQIIPSYLPQSGKPINVYALRNGREFKLNKVASSSVKIGNSVIRAGRLANAEFFEGASFNLPIHADDFLMLSQKLGFSFSEQNVVTFNNDVKNEEMDLVVKIGGVPYAATFKAASENVNAAQKTLKVVPKFNLGGIYNGVSYNVWALEAGSPAPVKLGSLTSVQEGGKGFVLMPSATANLADNAQLLFVDSTAADPNVQAFTAATASGKGINFSNAGDVGQPKALVENTSVTLSATQESAMISVVPVPFDAVQVTAKAGMFLYASQFTYDAPVNGQGNGMITVSEVYLSKGLSLDYERKLSAGSYWMIGGSKFKQMGYVDFYLTLQTQQGTWLFYRFPAAWPSGKYELDMQGSFMNLPIEFTCVALPGYNLPYIVYGEIQQ